MKKIVAFFAILIFFTAYSNSFAQMSQRGNMRQDPNNLQQPRMGGMGGNQYNQEQSITEQDPNNLQQPRLGGMGGNQSNQEQSITESDAKNIIQNYIDQNPSFGFEVLGYTTFTTPRGTNTYVFELQTVNGSKYMVLINQNGIILGPTIVENY